MRSRLIALSTALYALGVLCAAAVSQAVQTTPYTLNVAVDEVSVTFHAADFNGIPMDDLTLADLRILDNGRRPGQILSFESYRNLPVRVGFLIDTSRSMLSDLSRNQNLASEYINHLLHAETDHGFVMRFDSQSKLLQDWTGDRKLLVPAISSVASFQASRLGGTAIFDSVYIACRDQFRKTSDVGAGNFILLFSDGTDNASHALLEDDIRMCQSSNTAIYVFSNEPRSVLAASEGQRTLKALAAGTNGLIFYEQKQADILADLRMMDRNLRSQYRLVYRPTRFKHDGSFHRLKVDSPNRGGVITARSGYYAPR
ncbi:VWA domain-containing protein [Granulicella arctica]|uniref:VWA domain-containing protein n=1 Tax=Granulicella arctica TaxID=940613 RepID=UPI0021DFB1B5|nr:VWA domain-containing protein [Granulicella arctica]